ncbi:hypothetical protein C0585_03345 [Candidatus Woesearchaeota archaeon]|nr:MAG: hypothetical protein C0585_03345 [Candidatus Woesearchaeota archaeon]
MYERKKVIWETLILISVVLVITLLILEFFVDLTHYEGYILWFEGVIFGIFLSDLIILYRRSKNYKDFLKKNWLDIIATIPLGQAFRLAKFIRFFKILKTLKIFKSIKLLKALESVRLVHVDRILKIFSKKDRSMPAPNSNEKRN